MVEREKSVDLVYGVSRFLDLLDLSDLSPSLPLSLAKGIHVFIVMGDKEIHCM